MKKILYIISLVALLISCKENNSENAPIADNLVDHAESSVSGSFKSGRGGDMIDQIYSELIKNDNNLKVLDDKISDANREAIQVIFKYKEVLDKSESYYHDAQYHTDAISDSILKNEITKSIKASSDQYSLKVKNIKDLISQIDVNEKKMNDLYTAFKIRKTLPEIEKYQQAHPLKTDQLNIFINKQNTLLKELKNLK
ncbi:hypothetical protein ACNFU2_04515 [Chryseobacterium sp. PTM-20240506]|uniref:hypothetical protein n=1 Tax=unclassified Chryseobacterium TaxID=2593645 RepID=UPI0023596706|nr:MULTISPECIES: hypothetical protein [unclassified Chryseobacterium]MDC8104117.1 hypothetical protein [Chryseobacterium sp. B21-037]MDQ1803726.1 hypothetical protein [Chryseobacterium sp. CKR4-1]